MLTLNCYVRGTDTFFQVTVDPDDIVYALRAAIVTQWFQDTHISVSTLNVALWATSIPFNKALQEKAEDVACGEPLKYFQVISDIFPPTECRRSSTVHVVADLPPFILTLRCFVLGDTRGKIFTVEIHRTETVEALQDAIVAEWSKIDPTPVHEFGVSLWVASMLSSENFKEKAEELARGESLDPSEVLSGIFSSTELRHGSTAHVVADLPPRILTLRCFVLGDTSGELLTVEIDRTETVEALQDAIVAEWSRIDHTPIDESGVALWVASMLPSENFEEKAADLTRGEPLEYHQVLSDIFPFTAPRRSSIVHIVADLPPSILTLRYFVRGDARGKAFTIKIDRMETVEALQDAIVAEWTQDNRASVDETSVALWATSLPLNKTLIEMADEPARGKPLKYYQVLSDIFPFTEPRRSSTADVVADLPPATLTLRYFVRGDAHGRAFTVRINHTETVQTLQDVIIAEWSKRNRISVHEPGVALWVASIPLKENLKEKAEDLAGGEPLKSHKILSDIFPSLLGNVIHIIADLPPALLTLCCSIEGGSCRDVVVIDIDRTKTVYDLIEAIKGRALDLTSKSSLTLWLVSIPIDENFEESAKKLNLVGGSAVHTDDKQIQPISSPGLTLSSVISNPLAKNHVHIIFNVAPSQSTITPTISVEPQDDIIKELQARHNRTNEYYRNLQVIPGPQDSYPRFFPTVYAYRDEDGEIVNFKYIKPLETESTCVVFLARTISDPPRDIVIKFVDRYGEDAHRLLASENLAPRLFYVGPAGVLDGDPYEDLQMVAMEHLKGLTLHQLDHMDELTMALGSWATGQVRRALCILHEKNYVFGDLRKPNVMLTTHREVKLIDFDWAGEHDKATYPPLLSPEVNWPAGIEELSVMKKEHDLDMLARLLD